MYTKSSQVLLSDQTNPPASKTDEQPLAGISRAIERMTVIEPLQIPMRVIVFLILIFLGGPKISLLWAQDAALRSVTGVVLAEDTGKPLTNALVRVSSPVIDMRFLRGPRQGLYDARTDANGRFNAQVPQNPRISLNAFVRGYEEATGGWMSGNGTYCNLAFPSSSEEEFTVKLRPALYVAGVVTDESGRPFSGAFVEATVWGENSMGYIAFETTEANGRFEIFDFPLKRWKTDGRGQLTFQHHLKLTSVIKDVYAMSELERANVHVVLASGHSVKGVITSATGQPLPESVVEAVPADEQAAQRTVRTDAESQFVIRGLPDGNVIVRAHSSAFDQQARKTIQMSGKDVEVSLRMEPVVLKSPPKPVNLFGMRLADATPELQAVYDLDSPTGVIILDPGIHHTRLGIGELSRGLRFWIVGDRQIKNLQEMVEELLRIDGIAPPGDPNEGCHGGIRVVYVYRGRAGTNTQRLTLSDEDIAELKNIRLTITP
jgi:hypothetical protein